MILHPVLFQFLVIWFFISDLLIIALLLILRSYILKSTRRSYTQKKPSIMQRLRACWVTPRKLSGEAQVSWSTLEARNHAAIASEVEALCLKQEAQAPKQKLPQPAAKKQRAGREVVYA